MERGTEVKPRIVQCPNCRAFLQEPPPGNPFYRCGRCSATLQAKHATQQDVDVRMQKKALVKRMVTYRKTKSVSSNDEYKVFNSESSPEASERDEFSISRGRSPSWSPSRWESTLYSCHCGRSSQGLHRQIGDTLEKSQCHKCGAPRVKHEIPKYKVEVVGQNFQRLGVEENNESLPTKDAEGQKAAAHSAQKPVSLNHNMAVPRANGQYAAGGDRLPPKAVHLAARLSVSTSPLLREDSGQHPVETLQLSANYEGRCHQATYGLGSQHDMYVGEDILEYETSDYESTIGEGGAYQGKVVENRSRPSSGELDSYVVLDHRITRPGPYHRNSTAKNAISNPGRQLGPGGNERQHNETQASRQQLERLQRGAHQPVPEVQQRPTVASYHVQQPSLGFSQISNQPPLHSSQSKTLGTQNGHSLHESEVVHNGILRDLIYPPFPMPGEPPYVVCQHCNQLLTVPSILPPTMKAYQKLRCGACMKVSVFLLASTDPVHPLLLSDDYVTAALSSPKAPTTTTDLWTASQRSFSPLDSTNGSHRNAGPRPETDVMDRAYPPTTSAELPRLPPTSRNFSHAFSGSRLSGLTSAANGTAVMTQVLVSSGSSNLHSATGAKPGRGASPDFSLFSEGMPARPIYAPSGENMLYAMVPRASSGSDYEGHRLQDGRYHQTSSESDNDSPRQQVSHVPSLAPLQHEQFFTSSRMSRDLNVSQKYADNEGQLQGSTGTSKNVKGIMKKGVMELTKTKQGSSASQYHRKVSVNGNELSDVLVKRAEGLAGPIHPGSYWYDSHAGFWGLTGGPCLGIIPSHIEELKTALSRHCSNGHTGILVNGRELHKSDYDLLVRRGLPAISGMTYTVDIDGRLKEATSGIELRGLGPLAPTLEQTGRGHGMWVPGSNMVA